MLSRFARLRFPKVFNLFSSPHPLSPSFSLFEYVCRNLLSYTHKSIYTCMYVCGCICLCRPPVPCTELRLAPELPQRSTSDLLLALSLRADSSPLMGLRLRPQNRRLLVITLTSHSLSRTQCYLSFSLRILSLSLVISLVSSPSYLLRGCIYLPPYF